VTRTLSVLGVGVWTEAAPSTEHFVTGAAPGLAAKPRAQLLPARMRGRASLLTALFADVVEQATHAAALDPRNLPMIFASAYGEMGTTLALLEQLSAGAGQLSPAKFQASVHNTAAGQLSIALGNPQFSTALAAGYDTLAMALLEAWAWLEDKPASLVLACADEGASAPLQPSTRYAPRAAAFVLSNVVSEGALAQLELPVARLEASGVAGEPGNPCAPALALARAVFSGTRATLDLNPGGACSYSVTVRSCVSASC